MMKGALALFVAVAVLAGCGSGEAAKPTGTEVKEYKPETGKLSELNPGGGPPQKGAGTSRTE